MFLKAPTVLMLIVQFVNSDYVEETELRTEIMRDYNRQSLPGKNTTVHLSFTFKNIDVDEAKHILKLQLYVTMSWTDPRLAWNSTQYTLSDLTFNSGEVWLPDIALYNNAQPKEFQQFHDTMVIVSSSGKVIWYTKALLGAQCVIDTTYWPHDVQKCKAKFGSWVHNGLTMDVKAHTMETGEALVDGTTTLKFSDWRLLDASLNRDVTIYSCCPEPYVSILIRLNLERAAPAYRWLIQIPVVGLSFLTALAFILSANAGEKVFLTGTGLVLDLFFLLKAAQVIGHSPTHTPLILKLIVLQFLLTLTSLIVCVLVLRISRDPHTRGLPRIIKAALNIAAPFLLLKNYRDSVSQPKSVKRDESQLAEEAELNCCSSNNLVAAFAKEEEGKEWVLLGAFVDRVFLFIYILAFFVNVIYFSKVL